MREPEENTTDVSLPSEDQPQSMDEVSSETMEGIEVQQVSSAPSVSESQKTVTRAAQKDKKVEVIMGMMASLGAKMESLQAEFDLLKQVSTSIYLTNSRNRELIDGQTLEELLSGDSD